MALGAGIEAFQTAEALVIASYCCNLVVVPVAISAAEVAMATEANWVAGTAAILAANFLRATIAKAQAISTVATS